MMDFTAPFSETPRGKLAQLGTVPGVPTAFEDTARGAYVAEQAEAVAVEPVTFISYAGPDDENGVEYTSTDPGEINRLRLSRSHTEVGDTVVEAAEVPDTRFHPGEKSVDDVVAYVRSVDGNVPEVERVLAEEREGKNRPTVFSKLGQVDPSKPGD